MKQISHQNAHAQVHCQTSMRNAVSKRGHIPFAFFGKCRNSLNK
uniref:Uncharacterized protein n=1 Tax=Arundo donax TaxID=35708 RepID=A0A0A9H1H8_ARUDO